MTSHCPMVRARALPLAESPLADQLEEVGLHRDWLLKNLSVIVGNSG